MIDEGLESYCESIEEEFFRCKRRPGMLSPADFARCKEWYEAGVPPAVVINAISDAFDAHRAGREGQEEEINGLAFIESFVRRAVARRQAN